ncbi:hypothetical protein H310_05948 [Aphanomyces invadans]|uniref:Uncharacterized protein n=1 Tax=Aphanomyces invadans TaxID=157072 RepID=A0A024U8C1_9STRA|nr:hypothetical protein H310_05948 [Aphanomyces invadans]ETW02435.1 hypothetical protein H310_05948 [Aphanomyces invadans]|eukprot:XP_008869040.1 hypothetical protein H310_05948 [Aphanomyces invadans]
MCKTKRRLWSVKQGLVLGTDLYYVACGIRRSCLIDCMHMTSSMAETVLAALTNEFPAFEHVVAMSVDDNMFFVHRVHFVQAKLVDIAYGFTNLYVVDVNKTHVDEVPHRLSDSTVIMHFLQLVVRTLTEQSRPTIALPAVGTPSHTAVAGLFLNYPVIYSLDTNGTCGENTLAMQPLVVFELVLTSLRTGQSSSLLKYSLPQALLVKRGNHVGLLRAHLLVACPRKRADVVEVYPLSSWTVHVSYITLPLVAL